MIIITQAYMQNDIHQSSAIACLWSNVYFLFLKCDG